MIALPITTPADIDAASDLWILWEQYRLAREEVGQVAHKYCDDPRLRDKKFHYWAQEIARLEDRLEAIGVPFERVTKEKVA